MKYKKSLKPIRLVSHPPYSLKSNFNLLLADGVVAPGVVVCRVLLASYELLGMEKLPVGSHSDLVHYSGLQVHEDGPGNVFAGPSLREEGAE